MMQLRNESLKSSFYLRKVWPTRLGIHFLFVSTFAMLGGALRGFNLLLVVAGILVGALLIQWRWSRGAVMALSLRRRLPSEAYVGKPFSLDFEVTNHSRWMVLWLLRVDDRVETQTSISSGNASRISSSATIQQIGPSQVASKTTYVVPQNRGTLTFGPLRVLTSFPLDLLTARVVNKQTETLEVYPKLLTLKRGWQRVVSARNDGVTGSTDRTGPDEGEFFGLRPYRDGDTFRKIHWRTSARLDQPVVAQYEQSRRYELCVIVDAFLESPSSPNERVEMAISAAATIALRLAGGAASRIVVAAAGQQPLATLASGSMDTKRRVLSLLSRVQVTRSPDLLGTFEKASGLGRRFQDFLVLSPRSMQQAIQGGDYEISGGLDHWQHRGGLRWIDLSAAGACDWFDDAE